MNLSQSIIIISIMVTFLVCLYSAGAVCDYIDERRAKKHGKKKTNTDRRK